MVEADARFCGVCGAGLGIDDATLGSQAPTLGDSLQAWPHGGSDQLATGSLIGRDIIGQYVIRSKLGEGGMGEVYYADQPAIGRAVAIKVLHPHLTRGGDTHRRFQLEARAAAQLESPHIVQIFNYGEMADGTLFMAMELLRGRTLAELIRAEAPLHPARAVRITQQCCEALSEAHAAGIIHRDLKPSNLMLVTRGHDPEFVKVLDFGVAKLEGGEMTGDGALLGTPQYMSPEQLRAEPLDGRSDVYALGVILYEMLGGRPPFTARTPIGYVNLHLNEPPPAIEQQVPGLPPALAAAVMGALAKSRDDRPPSAQAWAAMLGAAVAGHATHSPHVGPPSGPPPSWSGVGSGSGPLTGEGAITAQGSQRLPGPASAGQSAPSGSRAWIAIVAALVSIVLVAGAALLVRSKRRGVARRERDRVATPEKAPHPEVQPTTTDPAPEPPLNEPPPQPDATPPQPDTTPPQPDPTTRPTDDLSPKTAARRCAVNWK